MQRSDAPHPLQVAPADAARARSLEIPIGRVPAIVIAVALVAAISLADYITGFEVRLAILFVAPVALATWTCGRLWGFAIALLATVSWGFTFESLHLYSHGAYFYWDGAVLGVTLLLFVELLSRLARALEHSDERFVRVLEGIDAAVYVIDDAGDMLYANRRLARLVDESVPPTAKGIATRFVPHADRAISLTQPAAWPDGTELMSVADRRRYVVQARDIPWVDRRRAHLVVMTDVTDQKIAQELALDHQETMHRTARIVALTEAASAVAHELNQPLIAIVGYNAACIRLLADADADPAEIREAMEKCRAQAVRAGEILRKLRELTLRRTPEFSACDLNAKVRNALAWAEHDLERAHVAVRTELAPRLPIVQADRVLIEQVVANLVQNAIDAMLAVPVPQRHLTISTSIDADGSPRVRVTDRGPGISDDVAPRLYTSFFTTKKGGLGLGLSICRSVVEMHGGRLEHGPGEHGGATFQFSLPAGAR